MDENEKNEPLILGVEQDIVSGFLKLFRDSYRQVDMASFYLEAKEGVSNASGIANVRDALSHFSMALQQGVDHDTRLRQLVSAEEHLRRAILEPYERALIHRLVLIEKLYATYKSKVLPNLNAYPSALKDAPLQTTIEKTLQDINRLNIEARAAKGMRIDDEGFQQAVANLIDATDIARNLSRTLETYNNAYEQLKVTRTSRLAFIIGIIGILLGLIGILVAVISLRPMLP